MIQFSLLRGAAGTWCSHMPSTPVVIASPQDGTLLHHKLVVKAVVAVLVSYFYFVIIFSYTVYTLIIANIGDF